MRLFSKYKPFVLLVFIFVLLRSAAWCWNEHAALLTDSRLYLDTAYAIKQGQTLQGFLGNDSTLVSPLYLHVLVFLDHLHLGFRGLVALQSILSLICGLLIYSISTRQIGRPAALLVASFYWLCPAILYYEHVVMTEMLFSVFFFIALHSLFRLQDSHLERKPLHWTFFLIGLAGLIATKPMGKIFALIFALYLLILNSAEIVAGLKRRWRLAIVCGLVAGGLIAAVRSRTPPAPSGKGLSSVVFVSLQPILDMTYPPIHSNPLLKARLMPGMQFMYNEVSSLFGYRIPPKNAGANYVNYNYFNPGGLWHALNRSKEDVPNVDQFVTGWISYSLKKNPVGFSLFMTTQLYNAVVMLSGSFLDHAPDFYLGLLVFLKRPLLEGPIDDILAQRPPAEKELQPSFSKYFKTLFNVIRFKRWLMFTFRALFGLLSLCFSIRLVISIVQGRGREFIREEYFSFGIFMIFYLYAIALALTTVPLGRYFLILFSLCMVFVIKEIGVIYQSFKLE